MHRIYFLILTFVSLDFAYASDVLNSREQFQQKLTECTTEKNSRQKPPVSTVQENQVIDLDGLNCHQKTMIELMFEKPKSRELVLIAALYDSPLQVAETVKTAIDFGMAPLVVINRAIETVPEHSEAIANGAIKAGVDFMVATEATTTVNSQ